MPTSSAKTKLNRLDVGRAVMSKIPLSFSMTHWDMLDKENSNLVALFNMSQCVICSPVWRFLYHVLGQLQMTHPLYLI